LVAKGCSATSMAGREQTITDRYRIAADTGCIVSNRLLLNPILCASPQIRQLLTGRITQEIKGHSSPITCCARAPFDPRYGRGEDYTIRAAS